MGCITVKYLVSAQCPSPTELQRSGSTSHQVMPRVLQLAGACRLVMNSWIIAFVASSDGNEQWTFGRLTGRSCRRWKCSRPDRQQRRAWK